LRCLQGLGGTHDHPASRVVSPPKVILRKPAV
jgi:hypothetical protein